MPFLSYGHIQNVNTCLVMESCDRNGMRAVACAAVSVCDRSQISSEHFNCTLKKISKSRAQYTVFM